MTNTIPLEENELQITNDWRIAVIPRNLVLREKYETSVGRGKGSVKSGEFAYRDAGYYGTIKSLANALINKEVIKAVSDIDNLAEVIEHIDKVKEEVLNNMSEYITIDLAEGTKKKKVVKGMEVSER